MQSAEKHGFSAIRVAAEQDGSILDALAAETAAHRFLREAWYRAASKDFRTIAAARTNGEPLLALPLADRRIGPLRLPELAGPYWPQRSFPIAADATDAELIGIFESPAMRKQLGRVWRYGPVYSDDPTARRLPGIAEQAGWTVLQRQTGTCFELDIASLQAAGPWPKSSTLRKNRLRRERRLEADGELAYSFFTGVDWSADDRDAMATVEAHCWLATLDGGGDTKFRDPDCRAMWACIAADPVLAPMLFGSLMRIGETPAAFTFGLEVGDTRYYIANNYDERFSKFGPGKVLLYKDFELAAGRGIDKISWGAGDAGYKSEMGAEAGPEILDLLLVRGAVLAACIKPFFLRKTSAG